MERLRSVCRQVKSWQVSEGTVGRELSVLSTHEGALPSLKWLMTVYDKLCTQLYK